nr:aminopeptidase [Desulfobacterales bacterium]
MFKLKPNETFVITADTESDPRVVEATATAAFAAGAKPMVIWTASPLGVGKAADPMLPVRALTAVLNNADAWVEFNNEWLLYSTPYEKAMKENNKLRYLCLVGMNVDMM